MSEITEHSSGHTNGGAPPRVDPTKLTTDMVNIAKEDIRREAEAFREVVFMKIDDNRTEIMSEIRRVNDVNDQKYDGIEQQFDLVERGRVEQKIDCVEASTPILCADLVWRPAGELRVDDELIACDEEPQDSGQITPRRRLRRSIVIANSLSSDKLFRVNTSNGTLNCNGKHPWLTYTSKGPKRQRWSWVKTEDLIPGDKVLKPMDVWEVDKSYEAGWLAGMFDGEGHLYFDNQTDKARLGIVQRNSLTADKIQLALEGRLKSFSTWQRERKEENWSDIIEWSVSARADIMMILGSIRPSRLLVNSDRVWEDKFLAGHNRAETIISIDSIGKGTIANLSTSTKTYIANGFVVHNTKQAVDAALIAQKEAVKEQTLASEKSIEKSEAATTKQIDSQSVSFGQGQAALTNLYNDLKERVVIMEASGVGRSSERTEHRADTSTKVAIAYVVAAFGGLAATILGIFLAVHG